MCQVELAGESGSGSGGSNPGQGTSHGLGPAILFMAGFSLQTALVDAAAKFLSPGLDPFQVVWGYLTSIMVLLCGYFLVARVPWQGYWTTRRLGLQMLRPALLVVTIGLLFIAFTDLALATAIAITFTSPLFVTALSGPLLGEKIGIHRWLAVLVGMLGVWILLRPEGGDSVRWSALLAVASAFLFALFQIVTRRLSSTEPARVTLFHTALWGGVWSSLVVPFFWLPPELWHWFAFLGLGILGVGAHFCMIAAFQAAEASVLAPFHYVKLVWVTILGYLIWGEVPTPTVWLGMAIIIASGLYIYWRERRGTRPRRARQAP